MVEQGWAAFLEREFGGVPREQQRLIAEMVAQEPQSHEWRVYDAALDRLECAECGSRLGRGPEGCPPCDLADGFRYAAIEIDRPGVPPGNEHAIRVNVAVLRRPHILSPAELLGRRKVLPMLIAGGLPTTAEAQRMAKRLKRVNNSMNGEQSIDWAVQQTRPAVGNGPHGGRPGGRRTGESGRARD
jgi:hypothetical protein